MSVRPTGGGRGGGRGAGGGRGGACGAAAGGGLWGGGGGGYYHKIRLRVLGQRTWVEDMMVSIRGVGGREPPSDKPPVTSPRMATGQTDEVVMMGIHCHDGAICIPPLSGMVLDGNKGPGMQRGQFAGRSISIL